MFGTDIMIELRMFGFTTFQNWFLHLPHPFLKHPKGAKTKAVFSYFCISIFCQTFGGVIKLDCCLWALSGPEGGGHNF